MTVNQVYSLLNSMAQQMYGDIAITVNDLTGLIQMGELTMNSSTDIDNFLGVLADRIGRVDLRTLDLALDFPKLYRNTFEWGAAVQKINIQPMDAQEAESWNIGQPGFTPTNFKIDKPVVSVTYFKNAAAWEFDITIPDSALKTAFTGAEAFGAFIDGIMQSMTDSMTIALNNMAHGALCAFVAEKVKNSNGVIHALTDYNTLAGTSYSALSDAIRDAEFYRYVGLLIRNHIKYLSIPSTKYNTAGLIRSTARNNLHVLINSAFWSGFETYLASDVFHDELLRMPQFEEFIALQGVGTGAGDIDADTFIDVIPPSEKGQLSPTAVSQPGVICILADRAGIGFGYDDRFTATDRNNRNRYTNYTSGATVQAYIDTSENGIIICGD